MSDDLFKARVRVALADKAQDVHPLIDAEKARLLSMAVDKNDCSKEVIHDIRKAIDHGDGDRLLSAFWSYYSSKVNLYPVKARLLVNPPPEIHVCSNVAVTYITHNSFIGGKYGYEVLALDGNVPSLGSLINFISGEVEGYFDDIVIFSGKNVKNAVVLFERLVPGSTLTLVYPGKAHRLWMGYCGLNLRFEEIVKFASSRFQLKELEETSTTEDVSTELFGLETR